MQQVNDILEDEREQAFREKCSLEENIKRVSRLAERSVRQLRESSDVRTKETQEEYLSKCDELRKAKWDTQQTAFDAAQKLQGLHHEIESVQRAELDTERLCELQARQLSVQEAEHEDERKALHGRVAILIDRASERDVMYDNLGLQQQQSRTRSGFVNPSVSCS